MHFSHNYQMSPAMQSWNLNGQPDRQVGSHEDLAKSSQGVSQPNSQMNGISSTADRAGSLIADAGGRRPNLHSWEAAKGWRWGWVWRWRWGFHLDFGLGYWQALPRAWRHNHKIPKFNKHFHRIFGIANRWLTRFTAFCIGVSLYTLPRGILILVCISVWRRLFTQINTMD